MSRCKFTCVSITKRKGFGAHPYVYDAAFNVVTAYSYRERPFKSREEFDAAKAEDELFFAATPSGSITVGTMNADRFVVGKDYYVDFSPVDAEVPA